VNLESLRGEIDESGEALIKSDVEEEEEDADSHANEHDHKGVLIRLLARGPSDFFELNLDFT